MGSTQVALATRHRQ